MRSAPEPCLVLDGAARAGVRVGVLREGRWVGQGVADEGVLEALFPAVEQALQQAQLALADIRSFVVCIGPGSVLGIRMTAIAVRSWTALEPRPIFVYAALEALAYAALTQNQARPFLVASESRLKRWNAVEVDAHGELGVPFEAEAAQLNATGRAVLTASTQANVLTQAQRIEAPWAALPPLLALPGFLRQDPKPDALNVAQDFATWNGARHRREG